MNSAGGVRAKPSPLRVTREDIQHAIEHGYAVVEAEVGAGFLRAAGSRSEGHWYPLQVQSVLLPATAAIATADDPPSSTNDYSKKLLLKPGRYVLILKTGPYHRAEPLSSDPARLAKLRLWCAELQSRGLPPAG